MAVVNPQKVARRACRVGCLIHIRDHLGGLFILAENLHFRWPIIGGKIIMDDELISEARKIAIDFNGVEQKLKPVHLQHRMRIGINRATKLYEQLKNEGLV